MKLYDLELSGNCYKVRLFAALTGIELECIAVDFMDGEHKRAPIIDLNPFGQLPVLVDGDVVLRDSQAILVYLARKYAAEKWYPTEPAVQADIQQWLSAAVNEVQHGPADARLVELFGFDLDKAHAITVTDFILPQLETHLSHNDWLVGEAATIADCAVMPYVALARDGKIDLDVYPAILRWIERIKALPGFIAMPGI